MTDLMTHFNHPYRTLGNMRCPWHGPDLHPSARLYEDQNTFWCWTCNPEHGVDVIEFVVIELNLEVEVDPDLRLKPGKRRPLAILRALDYLEEHFNCAPDSEAFESRIATALYETKIDVKDAGRRYWFVRHAGYLEHLARCEREDRFELYAKMLEQMEPLMDVYPAEQAALWEAHVSELL